MSYGVKPPAMRVTLKKRNYKTRHIIDEVQEVLRTDADDTAVYAQRFSATRAGMQQLYREVYNRITYVEDPNAYQWVQTPSFLWHHTRRGDCKSLAVFISSVLQNMEVRHLIRYVSYRSARGRFTHVYVVAIIDGMQIPLDITYGKQEGAAFGQEKPYKRKQDFVMEPGLYKLGATEMAALTPAEQRYAADVQNTIEDMELALAEIPDSIVTAGGGDITTKTQGQLDRMIWQDRFNIYANQEVSPTRRRKFRDAAMAMQTGTVSGIFGLDGDPLGREVERILRQTTSTAPAFDKLTLVLGNAPTDPAISGIFKKIGGFFRKVGDTFKNLFKKFANWIWKGPAKRMGGFFLFLFANRSTVRSPEIRRRIASQERSLKWIAKKGRFSENQLKGIMLNGIQEDTRRTPKQIFQMGKSAHITGLPAVLLGIGKVLFKAIGWVIKVVQKIVGLFKGSKRQEAGTIDESTASDIELLEEEGRLQEAATSKPTPRPGRPNTTAPPVEAGGSGAGVLVALAAGVSLLLAA